jgi:hypothetical protein
MAADLEEGGHAERELSREGAAALIAQLYYDRADIARVSKAAAAAMDVVIVLVKAAIRAQSTAVAEGGQEWSG